MDKLQIFGGTPLVGEVRISGAKNATLPILFSSLLTKKRCEIRNVPDLKDVDTSLKLLSGFGVTWEKKLNCISVDASRINNRKASYELVKQMRASILSLAPLLARFGEAKISLPGGCAIGDRPVDQHISALKMMGANIEVSNGYIKAQAPRLIGCPIRFEKPTVTGTENIMMAASLAEGETVIENAACEPEIADLAKMLTSMGAKIRGVGSNLITIQGVQQLGSGTHTIMPDRIEAGTYMAAVCATKGEIVIKDSPPWDSIALISEKLTQHGAKVTRNNSKNEITVNMDCRPYPVDISTAPYPGFPTDMQAQFMAINCLALGKSVIVENIFENRFMHVAELNRMGAQISHKGNMAIVKGTTSLSGTSVMATDLRASASLVIAGISAQGESIIDRIYHLDRGYENIENKLQTLGATVKRVS